MVLLDSREGSIASPVAIYALSISAAAGGTTDPRPGDYEFDEGTIVVVTAMPDPPLPNGNGGYYFDHWELDGVVKTENPITVLMDKDHALLATFSTTPPRPRLPKLLALGAMFFGVAFAGTYLLRRE